MSSSGARGADPPRRVMLARAHRPDPGAAGADGRRQVLNLVAAPPGVDIDTSRGLRP